MERVVKTSVLITLCVIPLVLTGAALSEKQLDPGKAFSRATVYYGKGDWDKAIEENESILKQGLKSGNLFYNLGNCYLQKGALGMAILNYERARWLIPRDSDLLFNYAYARSLMKQQEVSDMGNMFTQFLIRGFSYITLGENILLVCAVYYGIIVVIIGGLFFPKGRPWIILFIIVFSISLLLQAIPLIHKFRELKERAIVIANITDAKFEPLPGADVHFPLYEGMKVDLLRTEGGWCKVKRPDGKIGWVKKDTIRLISNSSPHYNSL